MRIAKNVFEAATDHGDLWFHRFKKERTAGVDAPVMRHEKNFTSQIFSRSGQTILNRFRNIRRQEKMPFPERKFQDQRTVVG